MLAYELGYRIQPTDRLSLDLATFYNVYDNLWTYIAGPVVFENDPAPPHLLLPLNFRNAIAGETYGSELSVQWQVTDSWKLIADYSWLHMRLRNGDSVEQETPQHQAHLRTYLDLPRHLQFSAAAYYVGHITTPLDNGQAPLDSYIRLDLGLNWRPIDSLEIGVWGNNLLDRRHIEFGSFKTDTLTEIPSSVVGRITWRW